MLAEKIEGELAVIIRHLLTRFASQDEAKRLLHEQQKSEEALAIKREGFAGGLCGYLMASVVCDGMFIGNAEMCHSARAVICITLIWHTCGPMV
jgi:putative DNA primase/helicase